jgi:hypothetical protein
MTFLLRRGRGSLRRKVHIVTFDVRTGKPTMQALCGLDYPFNMTSNVSWGLPLCKRCAKRWYE